MLLSTSTNQHLAQALSRALDEPVLPLSYRRFADGELIVEVADNAELPGRVTRTADRFSVDDRAIVIGSTINDRAHIELLQLQDLALEGGADEIITVVPYLGYARQDVAHTPGQPVSARAMVRSLSSHTDRLVTVNPHERSVLEFASAETTARSAVEALAPGLDIEAEDPLFVAPDTAARDLARTLCEAVGSGSIDHLEKERIDDTTVDITVSETDVSGREVVLVDDVISTGGTMSTAARALRSAGVSSVQAACVHPVLAAGAYTRLKAAGIDEVVGTDTIESPVSSVSVAATIAATL